MCVCIHTIYTNILSMFVCYIYSMYSLGYIIYYVSLFIMLLSTWFVRDSESWVSISPTVLLTVYFQLVCHVFFVMGFDATLAKDKSFKHFALDSF